MTAERITVEGGPLDGAEAEIHPDCSRLGFFVHEEGDVWWGYYAHEAGADGRRVFRPGRPRADTQ